MKKLPLLKNKQIKFNFSFFILLAFLGSCNSSGSSSSGASVVESTFIVPDSASQTIQFYDSKTKGNDFPNKAILGVSTGLSDPRAVAYSTSNEELYVCDAGADSVLVYTFSEIRQIGEIGGTSNITPRDVITGLSSQISTPISCEVNNNELYVLDEDKVLVFDLTLLSRSVPNTSNFLPPSRIIEGGITNPLSGAKDFTIVGSNIFIANGDEIHVYPKTTSGAAEPSRILTDTDDPTRAFHDIVSLSSTVGNFLYVMNKTTTNDHYLSHYIYNDNDHIGETSVDIDIHISYKSSYYQENPVSFVFAEDSKEFYVLNNSVTPDASSISTFSIYKSGSTPEFTPLQGDNVQLVSPADIKLIKASLIN